MADVRQLIESDTPARRIINELGEGGVSYPYEKVSMSQQEDDFYAEYAFNTDQGTNYAVSFENNPGDPRAIIVGFSASGAGTKELTGEGDMVRVLNTVLEIAKEVYQENREHIDTFMFEALSTKTGEPDANSKRARIYRKFIERQFPSADIRKVNNAYVVVPEA